jgi:hypothetical protein
VTDKPSDLEGVLRELDACVATIKTLTEVIESLRADNAALHEQLIKTLSANPPPPVQSETHKRGIGRPKKNIDDSWMLEWFPRARAEFIAANKYVEPTDNAVLTWHFERLFSDLGRRPSRARSRVFQGKLKTIRNRLSDARNSQVKRPAN